MSIPGSANLLFLGGGAQAYEIDNSLRYRRGHYLYRTPSSAGNRTTWTYSCWFKRGTLYNDDAGYSELVGTIFAAGTTFNQNDWNLDQYRFQTNNHNFQAWLRASDQNQGSYITDGKYRDMSAWYHVVVVYDSGNSTAADRARFYINGERASASVAITISQNRSGWVNSTNVHRIGSGTSEHTQGYFAEVHFLDGTAVTNADDFGEYNNEGVWVPKEVSGVTYGTNGFYLDFSDASNIGADRSGNGNNFTKGGGGFQLSNTSSHSYDHMSDTPTNNHPTINALTNISGYSSTISEISDANLLTNSNGNTALVPTISAPAGTGKWYWEVQMVSIAASSNFNFGVQRSDVGRPNYTVWNDSKTYGVWVNTNNYNSTYIYGSQSQTTAWTVTTADVIGVALDASTGDLAFYKNGTLQVTLSGAVDTDYPHFPSVAGYSTQDLPGYNYGNRPFIHTPPSGYEPICTANLPAAGIKDPSQHFRTVLDTGSNILSSAQSVFSTGLWWIKDRTQNSQHLLVDSVRGSTKALTTPATGAEQTYSAPSGNSAVAWCWNLVSDRSNGFDIVTYTGTGTARTVSHSLGYAPEYMIVRKRDDGGDYFITYHSYLGAQYGTELNRYQSSSNQAFWNNTTPTSSVFTVGTENSTNDVNANYVAYLWRPVPGFSAMGGYKGNSKTDGPFIYLGFRPAYVYIKATSTGGATEAGIIYDSARSTYNPNDTTLFPQNEWWDAYISSVYSQPIDMLANGFKIRGTESRYNNSNYEYFYVAYAEHPLGGSNVSPSPAR